LGITNKARTSTKIQALFGGKWKKKNGIVSGIQKGRRKEGKQKGKKRGWQDPEPRNYMLKEKKSSLGGMKGRRGGSEGKPALGWKRVEL